MSNKCEFCETSCGNEWCSYTDNEDLAGSPTTVNEELIETFDEEQ